MRNKIKLINKICPAILLSIAIGVILFEVLVRLLHFDASININWKYHPVLGWTQPPGGHYVYQQRLSNKIVDIRFNSKGFHDIEHQLMKPSGKKRIVVIGDSFCEALQVNLKDTFFKILEKRLNNKKEDWEVINLGVGDFGTAQEYIALLRYGFAYSPDVVIHQIFPLNDIGNNNIKLYGLCKSPNDKYRPYFVESEGSLKLTYAQPVKQFLRNNLVSYRIVEKLFSLLIERFQELCRQYGISRINLQKQLERGGPEPLLYTYVDDAYQIEATRNGWKITEKIIENISKECVARNVQYIPMVVPFAESRNVSEWKKFCISNVSSAMVPFMMRDYPEIRLEKLFNRLGILGVFLLYSFEKYTDISLYQEGHFNEAGNLITAEILWKEMQRRGLVADK